MELDRVEYSRKLEIYRDKKENLHAFFPEYQLYLKYFVSAMITLVMVKWMLFKFQKFKKIKKYCLINVNRLF